MLRSRKEWRLAHSDVVYDSNEVWLMICRGDLKSHFLIFSQSGAEWKRADDWPEIKSLFDRRDQLLGQAMLYDFAKNWVVSRASGLEGPLSTLEVRKLLQHQEVGPQDLVWRSGWEDWQDIASVPEFFSARGFIRLGNVLALLLFSFVAGLATVWMNTPRVADTAETKFLPVAGQIVMGSACQSDCRVRILGRSGQILEQLGFYAEVGFGEKINFNLRDQWKNTPIGIYEVKIYAAGGTESVAHFNWHNLQGMDPTEFVTKLEEHRKWIAIDQQNERNLLLNAVERVSEGQDLSEEQQGYILGSAKENQFCFPEEWQELSALQKHQANQAADSTREPSSVGESANPLVELSGLYKKVTKTMFFPEIN